MSSLKDTGHGLSSLLPFLQMVDSEQTRYLASVAYSVRVPQNCDLERLAQERYAPFHGDLAHSVLCPLSAILRIGGGKAHPIEATVRVALVV